MKVLFYLILWCYNMIENYLIIYDVRNKNTKYNKIYKLLSKYYSKRLQKSVFLIQEDRNEMRKLSNKISRIIDQENDKLLIIPLCEDDWESVSMIGAEKKKGIEKKDFVIL